MQKIQGQMRRAMEDYNMIEAGDEIAVGLSGGKDSVALLCCMAALRRYYPIPFGLQAITLDPFFDGKPGNYAALSSLCKELQVPYTIKETNISHIVFDTRAEKSPCSLCANFRRGILHRTAKECGCNKVALGHHLDDVTETFYMNLLNQGTLGCFSPVTYLSRADLTVIRPMIYVSEQEIKAAVIRQGLPVVKSACPVDKKTERQHMKELLQSLEKQYPAIRQQVPALLKKGNLDRW